MTEQETERVTRRSVLAGLGVATTEFAGCSSMGQVRISENESYNHTRFNFEDAELENGRTQFKIGEDCYYVYRDPVRLEPLDSCNEEQGYHNLNSDLVQDGKVGVKIGGKWWWLHRDDVRLEPLKEGETPS